MLFIKYKPILLAFKEVKMNSIEMFKQWCKDNGYKPSDGKAILAYDVYRNFKPRGLLG